MALNEAENWPENSIYKQIAPKKKLNGIRRFQSPSGRLKEAKDVSLYWKTT